MSLYRSDFPINLDQKENQRLNDTNKLFEPTSILEALLDAHFPRYKKPERWMSSGDILLAMQKNQESGAHNPTKIGILLSLKGFSKS